MGAPDASAVARGAATGEAGKPASSEGTCVSCEEMIAHLQAFLDHECERSVAERLARHVADCAHCAQIADAEQHLRAIIRSRCAEQAPPELRARVLGRLAVLRGTSGVASVSRTTSTTVSRDGSRVTVTRTSSMRVERD
ncbi:MULTISPECIES: mycothiol system anti-sigma-R factor [Actinomyces]|uniref:Mycothiol system anti-sigma-R factor n=1 Tax=Actinomyces marmotae TaxID=2737173 RepID=A0A6M8BBG9_9ACTO|nr:MULTISPECIES: mycothiol system anti-sigma-R factor [Actinomyces]QKD80155.1 mycothiol system anti-sigma-R factor [Actinomyces marmotae]